MIRKYLFKTITRSMIILAWGTLLLLLQNKVSAYNYTFDDSLLTAFGPDIQEYISELHFNTGGNDFGGSILHAGYTNATGTILDISGTTKTCNKQLKWIYHNTTRGNRLWPLNTNSHDTLQTTYTTWWYDKLSLTGGLYFDCDEETDKTLVFWELQHTLSGNTYQLIWGVSYDNGGLNPSFANNLTYSNKVLSGQIWDNYWGTANIDARNVCKTITDIPLSECNALVDLYNSTNGDNWTSNTGWLAIGDSTPETACDWYGLACNNWQVSSIWLQSNNLSGTLPENIWNLTGLTYLSLYTNNIYGTIPESIANLTNLEELYLNANELTGSIPNNIGNLKSLTHLNLHHNPIDWKIPESLWTMTGLQYLRLDSRMTLEGTIPATIGDFSNLKTLQIGMNHLTGSIPSEFCNLTQLQALGLEGNYFDGDLPTCIYDFTELRLLRLSSTSLDIVDLEWMWNLTKLSEFNISWNPELSGFAIPDSWANLTNLATLRLYNNNMVGPIPEFISNITSLKTLELYSNKFVWPIPESLTGLTFNNAQPKLQNNNFDLSLMSTELVNFLDSTSADYSNQSTDYTIDLSISWHNYLPATPSTGDTVSFDITAYNSWDNWTYNTYVDYTISDSLIATGNTGWTYLGTGTYRYNIGDLANNTGKTVTFTATVIDNPTMDILNNAVIESDSVENYTDNNISGISIDILWPNVNVIWLPSGDSSTTTVLNIDANILEANLKELTLTINDISTPIYNTWLALMYNFDNRSELWETNGFIKDLSSYGNDAISYSGAYWTGNSKYSGAYYFDSVDDYISVPKVTIQDQFTFSTRVYIESCQDNGYCGLINRLNGVPYQRNRILLFPYHNRLYFQPRIGWISHDISFELNDQPSNWMKNNWHHISLVYNGEDVRWYIDGELVWTPYPLSWNLDWGSSNATLWRWSDGDYYRLNGYLDEVRIYNKALSFGDIQTLYHSNLTKINELERQYTYNQTWLEEKTYDISIVAKDIQDRSNIQLSDFVLDATVPILTGLDDNTYLNTWSIISFDIFENNLTSLDLTIDQTTTSLYDSGLVLMLNLDNRSELGETTGIVKDISINNYTGSLYWATYTNSWVFNGAYNFDGSGDYIDFGDVENLDLISGGTVSAWIKVDSSRSGSNYPNLVSKWCQAGWDTNWRGLFAFEDNRIWVCVRSWTANTAIFNNTIKDQRTYIVGTWDGTSLKIYQDWVLKKDNPQSVTPATNNYPVLIGKDNANRYFDGDIDEIRVWNKALSTWEIFELYKSNLAKINSGQWNTSYNTTELTGWETYTLSATATDIAGSTWSLNSQLNIDYVAPTVSINAPAGISTNNVTINTSILDQNLLSLTRWRDGTIYTIYDDSLVLMMNFDNRSELWEDVNTAKDISRYGHNGTWYNAKWSSNGKFGGAYSFDGTEGHWNTGGHMVVDYPELDFDNDDNFTLMWRVKIEDIYSGYIFDDHLYNTIAMFGRAFFGGYGIDCNYTPQQRIDGYCKMHAWVRNITWTYTMTSGNIYLWQWHHLALTYQTEDIMTMYLDGELMATRSTVGIESFAGWGGIKENTVFQIGWSSLWGNPRNMSGYIDEVRVYKRALSSGDIQNLYNSNLTKINSGEWLYTVNQTGLVEWTYIYETSVTDLWDTNVTNVESLVVDSTTPVITYTGSDSYITGDSINIQTTILENNLTDINIWREWNNYSIYDSWLVLMMNFDNRPELDENSDIIKDLSANNNGWSVIWAIWTGNGAHNWAYDLDGVNDYIQIPNNSTLENGENITVSAWVKTPTDTINSYHGIVVSKWNNGAYPGTNEWSLGINTSATNIVPSFGIEQWTLKTSVSAWIELSTGVWHNIVWIKEGDLLKIYIDGDLKNTLTGVAGPINNVNRDLYIGTFYDEGSPTSYAYKWQIDEIKIYNKALSDSGIQNLYHSNLAKVNTGEWLYTYNQNGLTEDTYNWDITTTDIANNNESLSKSISIDNTLPIIQLTWALDQVNTITGDTLDIEFSIFEENLTNFDLWREGTNYSIYDSWLILMMNFDNRSTLGEDANTIKDLSIYNREIYTNGTLQYNIGKYYNWLDLSGNNNYIYTDTINEELKAFSIWTYLDQNITKDSNYSVIGSLWEWWFIGYWNFTSWLPDETFTIYVLTGASAERIHLNQNFTSGWNNILLNYNWTQYDIYINTEKQSEYINTLTLLSNKDLYLGKRNGENQYFDWIIDEVKMYNRSLSTWEIKQLYESNLAKVNTDEWLFSSTKKVESDGNYTYTGTITEWLWTIVSTGKTISVDNSKNYTIKAKPSYRSDNYAIDGDFWFFVQSGSERINLYNSTTGTDQQVIINNQWTGNARFSVYNKINSGDIYMTVFKGDGMLSVWYTGTWNDSITEFDFTDASNPNLTPTSIYNWANYLIPGDMWWDTTWSYDLSNESDLTVINLNLSTGTKKVSIEFDLDRNWYVNAIDQAIIIKNSDVWWFIKDSSLLGLTENDFKDF